MLVIRSIFFNIIFFSSIVTAMVIGFPVVFFGKKITFIFWHYLSITLSVITSKIGGIKFIVKNKKNLLKYPAIYAVRHESIWETMVLIHKFKEPVFVLKEELLKIPLFGIMSKKAESISIDRNNGMKSLVEALTKVQESIAAGHPVIIFPEGTRVASGEHVKLKRGIALFYKKANCPVVPVIHNSGYFWPRRGFIKKPGTISVKFMDPIVPGLSHDEFMRKLTDVFDTEVENLKAITRESNVS